MLSTTLWEVLISLYLQNLLRANFIFIDYGIVRLKSLLLKFRNQTLYRDKLLTLHITRHFEVIKPNSEEDNEKSRINKHLFE